MVDNFAFCVAGCVAIVLSVNIAWELLFFDVKSSFFAKTNDAVSFCSCKSQKYDIKSHFYRLLCVVWVK